MLTQAASMLDMKQLEYFTIATADVNNGISHMPFQIPLSELDHTCNTFRHLTAIELRINAHNQCLLRDKLAEIA